MYQIIVHNGTVIDPANNIHDVLYVTVGDGKISSVSKNLGGEAMKD